MTDNTTFIEKHIIDLSGSSEKRFPDYPVFFHRGYEMAIGILYEKCQSRNVAEFHDFIRKELIPEFRSHIKGNESVNDRYRGAVQTCADVDRYIMRETNSLITALIMDIQLSKMQMELTSEIALNL